MVAKTSFLLFSVLVLGVNALHEVSHNSPLAEHTHRAQRALEILPAHCTVGATELILAEESRHTQLMRGCPWKKAVFHTAELLTDTAYYGFSLFNNGKTILSDVKKCFSEKCIVERVICIAQKLPGATTSLMELGLSTFSFLDELKNVLPKIVKETHKCKNSTETAYQTFLYDVVEKAILC